MADYQYFKEALHDIAKPCAFIHWHALEKNIADIAKQAGRKKIRIASKSIRSVPVLQKILATSDVFQGIMCYTAEEALFLYENGLDDLLIAYPIWHESSLKMVCNAVKKGAVVTLMVDCMEHIERLEQIAQEENGWFRVCIDLDLSMSLPGLHFGVHRSPLKAVEETVETAKRITVSSYLELDGLMGYEAQIAGLTDNDPAQRGKGAVIRQLKRHSMKAVAKKRQIVIEKMQEEDISLRFVNGGGTGSLQHTAKEAVVTEITVGSGFLNSHLFDKYKDFQYEAAAGFAIEITRRPSPQMYTCFGGGYVASGAMNKDKLPEVFLPTGAALTANEGVGEVQTPVKYNGELPLDLGDPIFFRHSKAGELCERFHNLYVIKDGKIIDTYLTYRGEGKCFL